jgi:hypothetical protein
MAPFVDSAFVRAGNFVACHIVERGPLRFAFELVYAPYVVGKDTVVERRVITLDANTRFNRVEEYYEHAGPMQVAAGIVLRPGEGTMWADTTNGIMAYWEPLLDHGHTAVAVILPGGMKEIRRVEEHLAAIADHVPGAPFLYYTGVGWSKGGIPDPDAWQRHVAGELTRIKHPLVVEVNARRRK